MRTAMTRGLWVLGLLMASSIGACGGGGGGSSGTTAPPPAPAPGPNCSQAFNIAGNWNVTENNPVISGGPASYCYGDTAPPTYVLRFTQSGSAVVATDDLGRYYNGTYCNGQIQTGVPFSYAEDGGMTTITAITISVLTNNTASFDSTWTWSDDSGHFCAGSTHGNASR